MAGFRRTRLSRYHRPPRYTFIQINIKKENYINELTGSKGFYYGGPPYRKAAAGFRFEE